jgi:predicted SprT family Zn-dependent metalloprotease
VLTPYSSPTPTKQRSPRKAPPVVRPSTPPVAPPSPTKLVSPSKKKPRIPPAPTLRPSLDAFWAPEVVNDWNDKHSPSKPLLSPKKEKWIQSLEKQELGLLSDSDVSFASPTTSPRKKKTAGSPVEGATDSPTVAQIRAQRKAFSETKHALADSFILEIDATITSSRISSMSQQTGGIKLVWSKTLKTTAGRANWRRETFRIRTGPLPNDFREEARHHCSIELAEKVIDDEERLYNVLAHEYCHLTTFMISEQRSNPHGAEFKTWGRKVSAAFADKGVVVTTKHSYQIEYKYVWRCGVCAYEFKRHSKSVDPARHSCGKCKGKLVQVKPVPRGTAKGTDGKPKEKSDYQVFVKTHFGRCKKEMEAKGLDVQMGKVMEVVAREYREEKERKAREVMKEVDDVELAFGGLNIGDE